MKIALTVADFNHATTKSIGIYNVALGLCRGLASNESVEQLTIRCDHEFQELLNIDSDKTVFDLIEQPLGGFKRLIWETVGVWHWAEKNQFDWIIYPKGFMPLLKHKKVKSCAYVHDVMHQFYENNYPSQQSLFQKLYFPTLFKKTLKNADLIVTNSDFTSDELRGLSRHQNIQTVGIGFETSALNLQNQHQDHKYDVLIYASSAPHKISNQIASYIKKYQQEQKLGLKIVVVGGKIAEQFDSLAWNYKPRLSEHDYQQLLNHTKLVIYASEYEGFGMPPLERLVNNQGVVASNIRPISDFIDESLLFDNDDYAMFSASLTRGLQIKEWKHYKKITTQSWDEIAVNLIQNLQASGHD